MNGDGCRRHSFIFPSGWSRTRQIEDLCHVEHKRDAGHDQHEDDEDGFLRGPRHVALHGEGTRGPGADDQWVHDKPIQVILPHNKRYLQNDPEKDGGHVVSQQIAFNPDFAFFVRVLGDFDDFTARVGLDVFPQFFLFVNDVDDVAEIEQCWCWDEDNLEDPEPNVWDWECVVIADVFTTRLFGVADHFGLFITPNLQKSHDRIIIHNLFCSYFLFLL